MGVNRLIWQISCEIGIKKNLRTTIPQLLVFWARFSVRVVVMPLFAGSYDSFLEKEVLAAADGRSPRPRCGFQYRPHVADSMATVGSPPRTGLWPYGCSGAGAGLLPPIASFGRGPESRIIEFPSRR